MGFSRNGFRPRLIFPQWILAFSRFSRNALEGADDNSNRAQRSSTRLRRFFFQASLGIVNRDSRNFKTTAGKHTLPIIKARGPRLQHVKGLLCSSTILNSPSSMSGTGGDDGTQARRDASDPSYRRLLLESDPLKTKPPYSSPLLSVT